MWQQLSLEKVCEKPHPFPLHVMDELLQPAFPNAMHHGSYI